MKITKDYKIAAGVTPIHLEKQVVELLHKDYCVQGGIYFYGGEFYQPMLKIKVEKPTPPSPP